jgi:hypothetical protein
MVKKTYHKKSSRKSKKFSRKHKNKGKGFTPSSSSSSDTLSKLEKGKHVSPKYKPNFTEEPFPDIENQYGQLYLKEHKGKYSRCLVKIHEGRKKTPSPPTSSNDWGQFTPITTPSHSTTSSKGRGLNKKSRKHRR